jgi:GWxTD domain-containing protein
MWNRPIGTEVTMNVRTALLLAGLILAVTIAGAATGPHDWKIPDKDWAKGPVRWIMSDEEEKQFKKLTTDEDRQAFAKAFWEKRDPTPGTPDNEYMLIFWQRVEGADKAYTTMMREGSITDPGRVFILLGPPSSTRKDSRYLFWAYEPSPVNGITEALEFSFASVETGTLLRAPKSLETYVAAHPETRGIGWKIPQMPAEPAGEVAAAPVKEHVEDTSPESQRQIPILDAIATKGSGPTDVPFQVIEDYYAAVDGTTLTVITIEAPREAAHGSGSQALQVFGRLQGADGKPMNLTGDLPFVPAAESAAPAGSLVYQARRNLKPGVYTRSIVIEDKVVKGQMGSVVGTITVPDYGAKAFAMSSLTLLASFGRQDAGLGPDEGATGAGLYSMGTFRLVPRATPALQKSDTLAFYYQVYNPTPEEASGKPSLESTYSFFLKDATGWKPFRKPAVKPVGQVELFALDLKDLLRPDQVLPVDVRMEAKVTDKVTGQSVTRDLLFTVR